MLIVYNVWVKNYTNCLFFRTQSRFWLMPSSTPDLVRTPPVLDVPVLCVVRPLMSVLSGELIR